MTWLKAAHTAIDEGHDAGRAGMETSGPRRQLANTLLHLETALAALDEMGTSPIAAAYIVHAIEVLQGESGVGTIDLNASPAPNVRETWLKSRQ